MSGTLFWRAALAFVALPGVVAGLVPLLLRPSNARLHVAAVPILALGMAVLLWCVREFYVAGRGTLAPWSPPRHLVTTGPFRFSRNPMYVGVVVILIGWALAFGGRALWIYAGIVAIAFHLRVVLAEEPWQARTFGDSWRAYRERVPRWLIRLPRRRD